MGISYLNLALICLERGDAAEARELTDTLIVDFRDLGMDVFVYFALAVELPALAALGAWEEFEEPLAEFEELGVRLGTVDPDLAMTMQLAGERCLKAGRNDFARRAFEQARLQLDALGLSTGHVVAAIERCS